MKLSCLPLDRVLCEVSANKSARSQLQSKRWGSNVSVLTHIQIFNRWNAEAQRMAGIYGSKKILHKQSKIAK
jgi:hypothetical protein